MDSEKAISVASFAVRVARDFDDLQGFMLQRDVKRINEKFSEILTKEHYLSRLNIKGAPTFYHKIKVLKRRTYKLILKNKPLDRSIEVSKLMKERLLRLAVQAAKIGKENSKVEPVLR